MTTPAAFDGMPSFVNDTLTPVSVAVSATVKALLGNGRKQRVVSSGSQPAGEPSTAALTAASVAASAGVVAGVVVAGAVVGAAVVGDVLAGAAVVPGVVVGDDVLSLLHAAIISAALVTAAAIIVRFIGPPGARFPVDTLALGEGVDGVGKQGLPMGSVTHE
jgi:hypothetical protein